MLVLEAHHNVAVALVAFIAIATEYFIRYIQDRPVHYAKSFGRVEWDRNMKVFTAGLIFIITCILIRYVSLPCVHALVVLTGLRIYSVPSIVPLSSPTAGTARSLPLSCGSVSTFLTFRQSHILTRCLTDLFDGTMIVLAMWALNVIHPGQWMRTPQDDVVLPKDMHTMSTLNDSASRV